MLLEDGDKSNKPVGDKESYFPVDREFKGTTYADRYNLFCKRLVGERLYRSTVLMMSPPYAVANGRYWHVSPLTVLEAFVTELAGHIAAVAARALIKDHKESWLGPTYA